MRLALALAAVCAIAILLGALVTRGPTARWWAQIDVPVRRWFTGHYRHRLTHLMSDITELGTVPFVFVSTALLAAVAAVARRWTVALYVITVQFGANVIAAVGKIVVPRGTPVGLGALGDLGITGYAFPSGHAARSLALAAGVVVLARALRPNALGVVAAGSALYAGAVGVSRIVLNVHWVSDVLGAWFLVGAWAVITVRELDRSNQIGY